MNVVIICSDTFRYDHLGFVGRHEVFTPNLDALAKESACFSDFCLCSFPTLVNRIEVFTGRYTFPLIDWGRLPFHYPVLSQVFKHNGFATGLVADNLHLMQRGFGFARGFDWCVNVPGQAHDRFRNSGPLSELPCPQEKLDAGHKRVTRYRRNKAWYDSQRANPTERVFTEALQWLQEPREKFFLWIDAFDPHEPWDAPKKFQEKYPWNKDADAVFWPKSGESKRYSVAELENMRTLYRAEVTQIDHWVGRLLNHLRDKNLLQDTAILFCSDHGYYLGEHGLLGKPLRHGTDKPTPIYDELGHIPLLLRHPAGLAAGQKIDGLCQPPDLYATALDLAGIAPVEWAQGNSLVDRLNGASSQQPFAIGGCHPRKDKPSCLTVWTDEWCLVFNPRKGLAESELYHRPSDPEQTRNVMAENPQVAQRLYKTLTDWLDQLKVPPARQAQLLEATPAPRLFKLSHRLWMFKNRLAYHANLRTYKRTARQNKIATPAKELVPS